MNKIDTYAFFDVDNTILKIKSMESFQEFYCAHSASISDNQRQLKQTEFKEEFTTYFRENKTRQFMNRMYYRHFKNRSIMEVSVLSEQWWQNLLQTRRNNLFVSEVVTELKKHQNSGHGIVFVSGSFREALTPIGKYFCVTNFLCTELEVSNQKYTGEIIGRQMIGDGKGDAIREFLLKKNSSCKNCFSYGDHISDLPMLEAAGYPRIVKGDQKLEAIAQKKGWMIFNN